MELWDFDTHSEQWRDSGRVDDIHIWIHDHEPSKCDNVANNKRRGIRNSNHCVCGDDEAGDGTVRGGKRSRSADGGGADVQPEVNPAEHAGVGRNQHVDGFVDSQLRAGDGVYGDDHGADGVADGGRCKLDGVLDVESVGDQRGMDADVGAAGVDSGIGGDGVGDGMCGDV